ncbi:MAG: choice-of-anchor V domain-containing protein [Bacteroidota bacterium]
MKLRNVYKLFILALLYVGLQSRSAGPAGVLGFGVTGAPGSVGSDGTCGNVGCHFQGDFSPTASIQLLDGSDEVTEYIPGKAYTVRVSIVAGDGTPSSYGFQAVPLDDSESQAGTWSDIGSGQQAVSVGTREYLEHSNSSQNNTFESEWTAPELGTGDVTFYAAGIAANNNGTSTGDGTANTSLVISESPVNSISGANGDIADFDIFPNPVKETLNLDINSRITGDFEVRILDVVGRVVTTTNSISLQSGQQVTSLSVGNLTPGLYIVQLAGEDHQVAVKMLKK